MKPYYFIEIIENGISEIWPFSWTKNPKEIQIHKQNVHIIIRKINRQGIFIVKEWDQ